MVVIGLVQVADACSRMPESEYRSGMPQLLLMIQEYGSLESIFASAILLALVDVLVIAFHPQKRALHDLLSRSRVVTLRSPESILEQPSKL